MAVGACTCMLLKSKAPIMQFQLNGTPYNKLVEGYRSYVTEADPNVTINVDLKFLDHSRVDATLKYCFEYIKNVYQTSVSDYYSKTGENVDVYITAITSPKIAQSDSKITFIDDSSWIPAFAILLLGLPNGQFITGDIRFNGIDVPPTIESLNTDVLEWKKTTAGVGNKLIVLDKLGSKVEPLLMKNHSETATSVTITWDLEYLATNTTFRKYESLVKRIAIEQLGVLYSRLEPIFKIMVAIYTQVHTPGDVMSYRKQLVLLYNEFGTTSGKSKWDKINSKVAAVVTHLEMKTIRSDLITSRVGTNFINFASLLADLWDRGLRIVDSIWGPGKNFADKQQMRGFQLLPTFFDARAREWNRNSIPNKHTFKVQVNQVVIRVENGKSKEIKKPTKQYYYLETGVPKSISTELNNIIGKKTISDYKIAYKQVFVFNPETGLFPSVLNPISGSFLKSLTATLSYCVANNKDYGYYYFDDDMYRIDPGLVGVSEKMNVITMLENLGNNEMVTSIKMGIDEEDEDVEINRSNINNIPIGVPSSNTNQMFPSSAFTNERQTISAKTYRDIEEE